MNPTSADPVAELSDDVKLSWHRFLDVYEPLRPDLYRYCRYLTRSPWDAEDLVQDTLARAFVTLGCLFKAMPPNPKAWLFRVASNLWIDQTRRTREYTADTPEAIAEPEPAVDPDAARTLIERLSPQERAAVVLKDVFDFTLEETAQTLSTTVAGIKAALYRGRSKLRAPAPEHSVRNPMAPAAGVLDAFCEAFNARDLNRLTALLLDTAVVEMVGLVTEYGPEAARDAETGSFHGMLFGDLSSDDPRGGVERELRQGVGASSPRVETRSYRDEPVLLFWYAHADGDAVRAVARVETHGTALTHVRNYFFVPDVLAEICRELDVPWRSNGYRYWFHS